MNRKQKDAVWYLAIVVGLISLATLTGKWAPAIGYKVFYEAKVRATVEDMVKESCIWHKVE